MTAFEACLAAGLHPVLTSEVQEGGNWREGEYDIAFPGSYFGMLHEDIAEALRIAEAHGGRLWMGQPDQKLSILFPYEPDLGPSVKPEEQSPAEKRRLASRGAKVVEKPKTKSAKKKASK